MRPGLFRVEALAVALAATLGLVGLAVASRREPPGAPGISAHRVDVNTASKDELALLGVGARGVDALVAGRPWSRLSDVEAALGPDAWAKAAGAITLGQVDVAPVASR